MSFMSVLSARFLGFLGFLGGLSFHSEELRGTEEPEELV
jgi:hypothetical protein